MSASPGPTDGATPHEAHAALARAVDRALGSAPLERSRVAARTLRILLERTLRGEETTQYDLAEALYGDAADADRARAAVRTLRRRLTDLARSQPEGERLSVPLGRWRLELERPVPDEPAEAAEPPPGSWWSALAARLSRRVAVALLAGAALAGVLAGAVSRPDRVPSILRWKDASVVALDRAGQELWAVLVGEDEFDHGRGLDGSEVIADLDGEEGPEVAFVTRGRRGFASDAVRLFHGDGEAIDVVPLTPPPDEIPQAGGRALPPFFHATFLSVWRPDPDRPPLLVAGAAHRSGSASLAALLDERGEVLGRYWHVGHLAHAASWDFDEDGREELVLSGTNNDLGGAAFAILERDSFLLGDRPGAGPHRPGQRESLGLDAAPAQVYVLVRPALPRGWTLRATGGPVTVEGERLAFHVGLEGLTFSYRFTRDLEVEVEPRSGMKDAKAWLTTRRTADPSLPSSLEALCSELAEQVCIWRGPWEPCEP